MGSHEACSYAGAESAAQRYPSASHSPRTCAPFHRRAASAPQTSHEDGILEDFVGVPDKLELLDDLEGLPQLDHGPRRRDAERRLREAEGG